MFKMRFKDEIKGIKAIGFDVGHTLIKYNNPLNWQGLYRSGLEHAAAAAGIPLSEDMIGAGKLGIVSALINRSQEIKDFGQDYTLDSLSGIFSVLDLERRKRAGSIGVSAEGGL